MSKAAEQGPSKGLWGSQANEIKNDGREGSARNTRKWLSGIWKDNTAFYIEKKKKKSFCAADNLSACPSPSPKACCTKDLDNRSRWLKPWRSKTVSRIQDWLFHLAFQLLVNYSNAIIITKNNNPYPSNHFKDTVQMMIRKDSTW